MENELFSVQVVNGNQPLFFMQAKKNTTKIVSYQPDTKSGKMIYVWSTHLLHSTKSHVQWWCQWGSDTLEHFNGSLLNTLTMTEVWYAEYRQALGGQRTMVSTMLHITVVLAHDCAHSLMAVYHIHV